MRSETQSNVVKRGIKGESRVHPKVKFNEKLKTYRKGKA